MKAVQIKNKMLLFLLIFFVFTAKAQIETPVIQWHTGGVVSSVASGKYHVQFNKFSQETLYGVTMNDTIPVDSFLLSFATPKVTLHMDYSFVVDNYAGINHLGFTLERVSKRRIVFSIIQYTRQLTIDKIFFKRLNNGVYIPEQWQHIQPGSDPAQIYSLSLNPIQKLIFLKMEPKSSIGNKK